MRQSFSTFLLTDLHQTGWEPSRTGPTDQVRRKPWKVKGQGRRGQITKTTLWPFWPLSSAWFSTKMGMSIQCNILQIMLPGFWLEVKGQGHRGQIVKIRLWPFWPLSSLWISMKMGLTIQCHILQIILQRFWHEVKGQDHRDEQFLIMVLFGVDIVPFRYL